MTGMQSLLIGLKHKSRFNLTLISQIKHHFKELYSNYILLGQRYETHGALVEDGLFAKKVESAWQNRFEFINGVLRFPDLYWSLSPSQRPKLKGVK